MEIEQQRRVLGGGISPSIVTTLRAFGLAMATFAVLACAGMASAQSYRFSTVEIEGNQ
eukprot:CAMPEP_0184409506 /NCGR_PEP_ID=MMETSP0738-20130409/4149_1 /TAXON_ID=385413 /ORGANISM="Thalassiosira miniscula, Strain CCMP1093" /LENGTH=57 /DNA_ID=CAMNT_0026767243 /DNA_START=268 /DNA_END=438 /DNA_ORIENTATION=-